MNTSCKSCGNREEPGEVVESIVPIGSSSCSCPASTILGSPKSKNGLLSHSHGSDCGYSSSMEGSETGSREGSEVACTEGICNHDETGEYSCSHHCLEDKEEDGVDSCVEFWDNCEEQTKEKNKKKKRKSRGLLNTNEHHGSQPEVCSSDSSRREEPSILPSSENTYDPTASSTHTCQNQQTTCAKLCCVSFFSAGLQLPWTKPHLANSLNHQTPDTCPQGQCTTKSLMELLDEAEMSSGEENCLTQDEIESFVEENKSFYNTRDQYRQHLKDRFNKYCHSSVYRGDWLPTTSVK